MTVTRYFELDLETFEYSQRIPIEAASELPLNLDLFGKVE